MTVEFIREYKGWPDMNVEYMATFDEGATQRLTCSKDEWIIMETREKLIANGVDEDLLSKFEEAVREEAREDEWMSNRGECL